MHRFGCPLLFHDKPLDMMQESLVRKRTFTDERFSPFSTTAGSSPSKRVQRVGFNEMILRLKDSINN